MKVYNPPLPGLEELAPGVWLYPGDMEGAAYVGSIKSNRFHRSTCWYGGRVLPANRICFQSGPAAASYGYGPCSKCKPLEEPLPETA